MLEPVYLNYDVGVGEIRGLIRAVGNDAIVRE
jgi:hypothetical protein